MVIAALKTLTWGTVATAVVSALLLAYAGGGMPRIAAIVGDAVRERPAGAPAQLESSGLRVNAASDASVGTTTAPAPH